MGNYKPDFTNIECTRELIILHLYELTENDSQAVITAHDIMDNFECSRNSASNMLRALKVHNDVTRLNGRNGQKRIEYMITESGSKYAESILKKSMSEFTKGVDAHGRT